MITSQTVRTRQKLRQRDYQWLYLVRYLEESLGQLDTVQAQLAQDEEDLRYEIVQLQERLRGQQESGKVQLIQEMISVCPEAHAPLYIFIERFSVR
jgi:hypothetical protein